MKKTLITDIIGYVLLSPAIVSVVLFLKTIFESRGSFENLYEIGSPVSMALGLPFYIGVTALAGVYLIKDKK